MGKRVKPKTISPFQKGAAIYAAVALVLIGVGLVLFWQFLAAYEASRPRNTVNEYLDDLTARHILEVAGPEIFSRTDARIQDEAAGREEILVALQGKFTCARNISQSTGERQVYILRQRGRIIGSFWMEPAGRSSWGFTPWTVTGEEFDLSYLLSAPVDLLVPEDYTVLVNGSPLPESCVTQREVPYPELAEFAGDYDLPTMVRYETGPLLGEVRLTLLDREGNKVPSNAERVAFLDNCSPGEKEALDAATRAFIRMYVDYSSCNGGSPSTTLQWLNRLMVPNSALAKRMRNALDGLYWVSDRHASVSALEIGLTSRLSEGLYLCDVTYTVDTRDLTGQVQVESHVKLLFRQTGSNLLAEAMETC